MKSRLYLLSALISQVASGQERLGFETYYYSGVRPDSGVVARCYYQGKDDWYGEARYNYEAPGTLALYGGKTFCHTDSFSWSVTPMAGLLTGRWPGTSAALVGSLTWKQIDFTADMQYILSSDHHQNTYAYNWFELGVTIASCIYFGLVMQQTWIIGAVCKWQSGIQAAIDFHSWSNHLYIFSPFTGNPQVVLSVSRDWAFRRHDLTIHKIPYLK